MSNPEVFELGTEFPSEGFVQRAVEEHFARLGFKTVPHGYVDYYGTDPNTGDTWLVEAKGKTSQVGLDFRTGIGQLVQQMKGESVKYGLAIPNTAQFINQCNRVSEWVREKLGLYWLIVEKDGSIQVKLPRGE